MADQFYGLTDTGKQRSNNEDTFIVQTTADGKYIIACVIDGVGGYAGGEVAADITRKAIIQRLNKPTGEIIPILIDCFNVANQKILDEKQRVKEHESMACVATLVLIDIEKNQFHYAHVGDTRLYLLRDNSLIKISHDQSFVGYLEESRRITEEEAMAHPKRNEINKALGFVANFAKDSEYVETGQSPFLPGDKLLLCSDGLTDMVAAADITAIVASPSSSLPDQCKQLIALANEKGGADNITVVLAVNNKQPTKYNATMPASSQKKNEKIIVTDTTNEPAPAPVSTATETPGHRNSTSWITMALGLLTLLLLAGNVWQYKQNKQTTTVVANAVGPADTLSPDPLQLKLENAIVNMKDNLLVLTDSDYSAPIKISRAIQISRDTLFIKTKGKIELVADTSYSGAAVALSPQCKLVLLDSLHFKNFKTGVIAYNNVLLLKNVKFDNCTVAVQNLFAIPANKLVSGTMHNLKLDTLPVN